MRNLFVHYIRIINIENILQNINSIKRYYNMYQQLK